MPPRHVKNYDTTKLKGTLVCKHVIVGYVGVPKVILCLSVFWSLRRAFTDFVFSANNACLPTLRVCIPQDGAFLSLDVPKH